MYALDVDLMLMLSYCVKFDYIRPLPIKEPSSLLFMHVCNLILETKFNTFVGWLI